MRILVIIVLIFWFHSIDGQVFDCETEHNHILQKDPPKWGCIGYSDFIGNSWSYEGWNTPNSSNYSVPVKEIDLFIHIVQDDYGLNNYSDNQTSLDYLQDYIDELNRIYSNLDPLDPPASCAGEYTQDAKIRFYLKGVEFHQSSYFNCTDFLCGDKVEELNDFVQVSNYPNYLNVIIVGFRGERIDLNGDGDVDPVCDSCNNPSSNRGGLGGKYVYLRGLHLDKDDINENGWYFAHEIGHSLELIPHSWTSGSCCDTGEKKGSNNIMDYDPDNNYSTNSFTECQLNIMHYYLERNPPKYYRNQCEKLNSIITIEPEEDVEWKLIDRIAEDVHIFGKLKISCHMTIAPNVRIVVHREGELDIEDAYLTSCEGEEWDGIIIEGVAGQEGNSNGESGKLKLSTRLSLFLNQGRPTTIENAKTAISMNPSYIQWPLNESFFGGYINANGIQIRNCRRGVEFMRHGQGGIKDESSFTNVVFSNIRDSGVTIWQNDGVDFTNCTFTNVGHGANDHEGILAISSSVNVTDECLFENCDVGVTILSPGMTPMNSCNIVRNRFDNCDNEAINVMTANSLIPHEITNNLIQGATRGISVDGISDVDIRNNTIENTNEGTFLCNSGGEENPVHDNEFNSNTVGLVYLGNNELSTFHTNCFDGSLIDVGVTNCVITNPNGTTTITGGSIFNNQGTQLTEAGNCFSALSLSEVINLGTDVNYHVHEQRPPEACQRTPDSFGIAEVGASNEDNPTDCGSELEAIMEECALQFSDPGTVMGLIGQLDSHLSTIEAGQESRIARSLKNELFDELSRLIVDSPSGPSSTDAAIVLSFLDQRPEFRARALVPGIFLKVGDYNMAYSKLSALATQDLEEADYKFAQVLYLDYLTQGSEGIGQADLQTLENNALNALPLNAYSRSVHYLITGERITIPTPDFDLSINARSSSANNEIDAELICYPVPVNEDRLFLQLRGFSDYVANFQILRSDGHLVKEGQLVNNIPVEVATTTFIHGIYFVTVRNESGELITEQKFSIID